MKGTGAGPAKSGEGLSVAGEEAVAVGAGADKVMEKSTEGYWSARWANGSPIPGPVDPTSHTLANHVAVAYHRCFESAFADLNGPQASLLEVGCARSRWLPYFRRQFGFAITGLDYSEVGCDQARTILETAGIEGEVVQADLFNPAEDMLGRFDAVVSFGVVEHFEDTAACLRAVARFLKPGGRVLTFIPNMRGSIGLLQRWIARPVYDMHVPLRAEDLAEAHRSAGLLVDSSRYLLFANWGVVSLGQNAPGRSGRVTRRILSGASKACCALERAGLPLRPNPATSPYIACMARLPQS